MAEIVHDIIDDIISNLPKEKDVKNLGVPSKRQIVGDGTFRGIDKELDVGAMRSFDYVVDRALTTIGLKNRHELKQSRVLERQREQLETDRELVELNIIRLQEELKRQRLRHKRRRRKALREILARRLKKEKQESDDFTDAELAFEAELQGFLNRADMLSQLQDIEAEKVEEEDLELIGALQDAIAKEDNPADLHEDDCV